MIVNMHAAKTNLSKLIARAQAGEEVIIANAGKPVARLTPVTEAPPVVRGVEEAPFPAWMGSLKGQIWIAPDAFEPDEELIRAFEDSEIFPPPDSKP